MAEKFIKSECLICSKTFEKFQDLKMHMKSVHDIAYVESKNHSDNFCELCGKYYKEKTELWFHIRLNHDNLIESHYNCGFCGKSYKDKTYLHLHIRKKHPDTDEKLLNQRVWKNPQKCKLCEKSFIQKK